MKQLFEGLMRIDAEGIPQPALAERVEISEDLLTYTFHLRDALWSDHSPVTSEEFASSWRKALSPSFASDYSYMLYPIKNAQEIREGKLEAEALCIEAPDNRTLVVHLHSPTPYFLELTAFPTYFPVCSTNPLVCNGPFCVKKWTPQTELIFEKNALYWDSPAVHLDQIAFSILADNNTESYLFEKEELDWLGQPISNSVSAEKLEQLKKSGALHSYSVAGTLWFEFNLAKEPFNCPSLRKALSLAINRNAIIQHILQGNQSPATGPLPPSMAVRETPYFTDGDLNKAQEYLQEALLEIGTLPKIVLSYSPSERNTKIVQLVQQQWKEGLGITVELLAVERQLYRAHVRQGSFQVGVGEWIADFNDPLAFLELFKYKNDPATGSGMNGTGWQNETFITLLNQSLTETNPQMRQHLMAEAEKILIDEMPIAPLYHYAFDYVKKPYVHNVILSPLGHADFKTTTLEGTYR